MFIIYYAQRFERMVILDINKISQSVVLYNDKIIFFKLEQFEYCLDGGKRRIVR